MYKHDDKDHDGDDYKKFSEPPKYMVNAFFSGIIFTWTAS
jgi:hypothetical protein